jgi:hypothetical protein
MTSTEREQEATLAELYWLRIERALAYPNLWDLHALELGLRGLAHSYEALGQDVGRIQRLLADLDAIRREAAAMLWTYGPHRFA